MTNEEVEKSIVKKAKANFAIMRKRLGKRRENHRVLAATFKEMA